MTLKNSKNLQKKLDKKLNIDAKKITKLNL